MPGIALILEWVNIANTVMSAGIPMFNQIKDVLKDNGYEVDTAAIDEALADLELRAARAKAEETATE
jgi:hypothetical protein